MSNQSKIWDSYEYLKPTIISRFSSYLDNLKQTNRGRKRTVDLEIFFKAFYSNVRDGTSPSNFKYYFGLPKSTYFDYLSHLKNSDIFTTLNHEITSSYSLKSVLGGDSFTVKSYTGSEGVGRSSTGRNGIKVQILSDLKGVVYSLETAPANKHDSRIFVDYLSKEKEKLINYGNRVILLDSAYIGNPVKDAAKLVNLRTLTVPKKKRNGQPTHTLDDKQKTKIKQRWRIEQQIGVFRRFYVYGKAINSKFVRHIKTYDFFLSFAITLINNYHIVME